MNTKQRDVIFRRWCGVIHRETRDLDALKQVSTRALGSPDVCDDPTLQSMIRADLEKRRAELERELHAEQARAASLGSRADERSMPPEPISTTPPEQVRKVLNGLAQTLCTSLERGDEKETRAIFGKMRALQAQNPGVIPSTAMADYERGIEELRVRLQRLTDEIGSLAQQAVSASRLGRKQDLEASMRRLTAIQVAHPPLLDEAGLEEIRNEVIRAADERQQDRSTARKLVERQRTIAAEIKKMAATVHGFHRLASTVPDTSEEFRQAEMAYLRAMQQVRAYDREWFTGVVLDLADLLAEWTLPPLGTAGQIDRFLDGITAGLKSIRAEMREIESQQDSDEGDGSVSAAPRP